MRNPHNHYRGKTNSQYLENLPFVPFQLVTCNSPTKSKCSSHIKPVMFVSKYHIKVYQPTGS